MLKYHVHYFVAVVAVVVAHVVVAVVVAHVVVAVAAVAVVVVVEKKTSMNKMTG